MYKTTLWKKGGGQRVFILVDKIVSHGGRVNKSLATIDGIGIRQVNGWWKVGARFFTVGMGCYIYTSKKKRLE